MLYQTVVFLHVVGVLGFLLAHGVSASITFALKKERNLQRIRALLDLSGASYPVMMGTLFAAVVFGLLAAFLDMGWWRAGWLWVSIGLFVVILAVMASLGSGVFRQVRQAVSLATADNANPSPAEVAKSQEAVHAGLAKIRPILLLVTGYGGFVVIAFLMVAKPF